ncbi:MAG: hypothetical protein P8Y78_14020 [Acidihalobacter sp.]
MNAQNRLGGISSPNGLASVLGTTLYRGMSSAEPSDRGEVSAKHHEKTHHGLKWLLRRRH